MRTVRLLKTDQPQEDLKTKFTNELLKMMKAEDIVSAFYKIFREGLGLRDVRIFSSGRLEDDTFRIEMSVNENYEDWLITVLGDVVYSVWKEVKGKIEVEDFLEEWNDFVENLLTPDAENQLKEEIKKFLQVKAEDLLPSIENEVIGTIIQEILEVVETIGELSEFRDELFEIWEHGTIEDVNKVLKRIVKELAGLTKEEEEILEISVRHELQTEGEVSEELKSRIDKVVEKLNRIYEEHFSNASRYINRYGIAVQELLEDETERVATEIVENMKAVCRDFKYTPEEFEEHVNFKERAWADETEPHELKKEKEKELTPVEIWERIYRGDRKLEKELCEFLSRLFLYFLHDWFNWEILGWLLALRLGFTVDQITKYPELGWFAKAITSYLLIRSRDRNTRIIGRALLYHTEIPPEDVHVKLGGDIVPAVVYHYRRSARHKPILKELSSLYKTLFEED